MNQYWVKFQSEWWKAGKFYFGTIGLSAAALLILVPLLRLVGNVNEGFMIIILTAGGLYLLPVIAHRLEVRLILRAAGYRFRQTTKQVPKRYESLAPAAYGVTLEPYRLAIRSLSSTFPAYLCEGGDTGTIHLIGFESQEAGMLVALFRLANINVINWNSNDPEREHSLVQALKNADHTSIIISQASAAETPFNRPRPNISSVSTREDIRIQLSRFESLAKRPKDLSIIADATLAVIKLAGVAIRINNRSKHATFNN